MTKINEIYKCEICGNIVEILHSGAGALLCCGKDMVLMKENTVDASKEKHVPVIIQEGNKKIVKVGSEPHPMTPEHYIEFIEIQCCDKVIRKHLNPGDAPEATFDCTCEGTIARAYCNLHGLWRNE